MAPKVDDQDGEPTKPYQHTREQQQHQQAATFNEMRRIKVVASEFLATLPKAALAAHTVYWSTYQSIYRTVIAMEPTKTS